MAGHNVGSFIPTTNVWDVSEIYSTEVTSPEFKELLVRLYQNLNNQALSINSRDAGIYDTSEFVNGQLYFPNPSLTSASTTTPTQRQVYRRVINFGALPNTTTKSVNHNISISAGYSFTRIYATASDPVGLTYIPIPTTNITLSVSSTQVTIVTGSNVSNYTICYVVLEYIKS